jgi:NAD(P)H-hydrate epimerase
MHKLYLSNHIKAIDQLAARQLNISSYELMQKAAAAIFNYIRKYKNILVVAGVGNNAGDGFVLAQMARLAGIHVTVWCLTDSEKLPNDAKQAFNTYLKNSGTITFQQPEGTYDCLVDAIFGTGLNREVKGVFADAVNWINQQQIPVVAVDIPSGLDANTGCIMACAVQASITVSVICHKVGLFTNNGKDLCGRLYLENLGLDPSVFAAVPSDIHLLDNNTLTHELFQHKHNSHKGSFGQALIVGGHDGMLGALILAGRAALQSGCGIVEAVSNSDQAVMISLQCPELITASDIRASRLLGTADVIAIGPGLGLNQLSKDVLDYCISQNKAMVIDADALTLSVDKYRFNSHVVLTPHPKEAARLLNCSVAEIQTDRVTAAIRISQKYQANVVLKGSGTIICDVLGQVYICPFGYSGMATAGMGDVLTGIICSLMAQGFAPIIAAYTAVVWHALAAEHSNKGNCLIASDVIKQLAHEIL